MTSTGAPRSSRACSKPARRSRATSRPGRPFADVRYEDFLASAAAIGGPLSGAGTRPLGATIRLRDRSDVRAGPGRTPTSASSCSLAPLARAALCTAEAGGGSSSRRRLRGVLAETNVDDARDVYAAIRLAAPGGLGRATEQDVAERPDRDAARGDAARRRSRRRSRASTRRRSRSTFEIGAPALERARATASAGTRPWSRRSSRCWRRAPTRTSRGAAGAALAAQATRLAGRSALAEGGVRSAAGRKAIDEMDRVLRDERHHGNPGTTADLTAASIFVVLLGLSLGPLAPGRRDAVQPEIDRHLAVDVPRVA